MRHNGLLVGMGAILATAGLALAGPSEEDASAQAPGTAAVEAPAAQEPGAAPPDAAASLARRLGALPGLAAAPGAVREAAILLLTTPLRLEPILSSRPAEAVEPGASTEGNASLERLAARARAAEGEQLAAALAALRAAQLRALETRFDPRAHAVLEAERAALAALRPEPGDDDPTLPEAIDQALARGTPGPGAERALRTLGRLARERELRRSLDPDALLFATPSEGDEGAALRERWIRYQEQLREAVHGRAAASVELGAALDRRNRLLLAIEPAAQAARAQRELLDRLVPAGLGAPLDDAELARLLARLDSTERELAALAHDAATPHRALAAELARSLEALAAPHDAYEQARAGWEEAWREIDAHLDDVARARAGLWRRLAGAIPEESSDDPAIAALVATVRERARRADLDAPADTAGGDGDGAAAESGARAALAPPLRVHAARWLHDALAEIGTGELLLRQVEIALSPATAPSERGLALLSLAGDLHLPWHAEVTRQGIDVELAIGGRAFVMRDLAGLGALPLPRGSGGAPPRIRAASAPSLRALRRAGELLAGEVPDADLVVAAIEAAGLTAAGPASPAGAPSDAAQSAVPQALQ